MQSALIESKTLLMIAGITPVSSKISEQKARSRSSCQAFIVGTGSVHCIGLMSSEYIQIVKVARRKQIVNCCMINSRVSCYRGHDLRQELWMRRMRVCSCIIMAHLLIRNCNQVATEFCGPVVFVKFFAF